MAQDTTFQYWSLSLETNITTGFGSKSKFAIFTENLRTGGIMVWEIKPDGIYNPLRGLIFNPLRGIYADMSMSCVMSK